MKISTNLKQLKATSTEAYHYINGMNLVESMTTDFEAALGGDVFIIENADELNAVMEQYKGKIDHWDATEDCTYITALSITNNTGGPTFLIPKELWTERHSELYQEKFSQDDSYGDHDETNYDPYAGCDTFETYQDDVPF